MKVGEYNTLPILREIEYGLLLGDSEMSILLPRRFVHPSHQVGTAVHVFVCYDSEERLMATTQVPLIQVGEAAVLKVKDLNSMGAFLDWGLDKDLFLPFSEQTRDLRVGEAIVVFCSLDKSHRIVASMRLDRHIGKTPHELKDGQEVSLLIAGQTDLGYKAIVDKKHWGILYFDEVFQKLHYGSSMKGFIQKIRPDGKIDLRLARVGHKAAADDIGPQILGLLEGAGGRYQLSDKTDPEVIYRLFGVSKKKFKIALGALYKSRQIEVLENEIRLVSKTTKI